MSSPRQEPPEATCLSKAKDYTQKWSAPRSDNGGGSGTANASEWSFGGKQKKEPGGERLRPLFIHKGLACVFVCEKEKNNAWP